MAQDNNSSSVPSLTTGSVANPATSPAPAGHGSSSAGTTGSSSDGSWMNGIMSALMQMPTAPYVTTSGAGPSMKIDIDTVNNIISQWTQLRQQLDDLQTQGEQLTKITGPGTDDASGSFASKANSVGSSHQWANKALSAAVQGHIDKLQAAVQQYQSTDHGNAGNLNRQDS